MKLFKPIVRLVRNADQKSYAMDAHILVPNGCHVGAGAALGLPEGYQAVPEVEPVVLSIVNRQGLCTQAYRTVDFHLPAIPLNVGKRMLTAYAVVNGKVSGASSATIPHGEPMSPAIKLPDGGSSGAILQSVSGWISAMPPGPPRLVVEVWMWGPCVNYTYNLTEVGPFGFTGRTLLLNMAARQPEKCLPATASTKLTFERKIDPKQFDDVAIQFEGKLHIDALEITS